MLSGFYCDYQNLEAFFYNKSIEMQPKKKYTVTLWYTCTVKNENGVFTLLKFFDINTQKLYHTYDFDTLNLFQFINQNCEEKPFTFTSKAKLGRS